MNRWSRGLSDPGVCQVRAAEAGVEEAEELSWASVTPLVRWKARPGGITDKRKEVEMMARWTWRACVLGLGMGLKGTAGSKGRGSHSEMPETNSFKWGQVLVMTTPVLLSGCLRRGGLLKVRKFKDPRSQNNTWITSTDGLKPSHSRIDWSS